MTVEQVQANEAKEKNYFLIDMWLIQHSKTFTNQVSCHLASTFFSESILLNKRDEAL